MNGKQSKLKTVVMAIISLMIGIIVALLQTFSLFDRRWTLERKLIMIKKNTLARKALFRNLLSPGLLVAAVIFLLYILLKKRKNNGAVNQSSVPVNGNAEATVSTARPEWRAEDRGSDTNKEGTFIELRARIVQELREDLAKVDAEIKKYDDEIEAAMMGKLTVTGGAFANAARNACDKRAEEARRKKAALEQTSKWKREMLSKYR